MEKLYTWFVNFENTLILNINKFFIFLNSKVGFGVAKASDGSFYGVANYYPGKFDFINN